MDLIRISTIVSHYAHDFSNVSKGVGINFTVVPGLDCGEGVGMLSDDIGEEDHHVATVGGGDVAPGGVFECIASCGNCCVNVVG
jgi:hypothetical protein